MSSADSLVVRCPRCSNRGTWFRTSWGPFCSERCRLIDLGQWLSEEHRFSRPLNAGDFGDMEEFPPGMDPDRPVRPQ